MGFSALAPANMALPSGFATTWVVMLWGLKLRVWV